MGKKLTDQEQLDRMRIEVGYHDIAKAQKLTKEKDRFAAAVERALAAGVGAVEMVGIIRDSGLEA